MRNTTLSTTVTRFAVFVSCILLAVGCATQQATQHKPQQASQQHQLQQAKKQHQLQQAQQHQPNAELRNATRVAFKERIRVIKLLRTINGHSNHVYSVAFSPDGKTLASGSRDGILKLWNPRSGKLLRSMNGHNSDMVTSVAFSPDGQTFASGSGDNTIKLWNPRSGKLLRTINGHSDHVDSVAFSPDGKTLASGSRDGILKLWNPRSGKLLRSINGHNSYMVTSVAFSPDGKTLASGSRDGILKLWNTRSGKLLRTLNGHSDHLYSVAFSPDGKTLASGSRDGILKLWNPRSGKLLRTMNGHNSHMVTSIAFSPDGKTLASGSGDNTIKLWNPRSGKLLGTTKVQSNDVFSVAFSPAGTLASGSTDNTIKLWQLPPRLDANDLNNDWNKFVVSWNRGDAGLIELYQLQRKYPEDAVIGDAYVKASVASPYESGRVAVYLHRRQLDSTSWRTTTAFIQQLASDWLNLKEIIKPAKIIMPTLPPAVELTQENWEGDSEFETRVAQLNKARQARINQLQADYRHKVEVRNSKVSKLERLQQQRHNQLASYVQGILDYSLETQPPALDKVIINQQTLDLYADLVFKGTLVGRYKLAQAPLKLRKQAMTNSKSVKVLPNIELSDTNDFRVTSITILHDDQRWLAQASEQQLQHTNTPLVATIGNAGETRELSSISLLQKQNPNLVDVNSVGTVQYKDGTTALTRYQDDLTPLVQQLAQAPIDQSKWLFVIGAERYQETDNILFARRSAENFALAAKKSLGIDAGHTITLYDEQATSGQIKTKLKKLLRDGISSGDSIIIYYNGHGLPVREQDDTPYMLPTDMIPDFVSDEPFFKLENMYALLAKSKAGNAIVIMDSCFTGGADGRSVIKGVAAARLSPKKLLIDKSKLIVMTAGTDKQYSTAFKDKGYRLFSYYLIKRLVANKPQTVEDWFESVQSQVKTTSRQIGGSLSYQDPQLLGSNQQL